MSPKTWEEKLTDAYWDYRWHTIMEPLCETFQAWKAGQLGHEDVDRRSMQPTKRNAQSTAF